MAASSAKLKELVHHFVRALTLHRLYGPSHPHVRAACEAVAEALRGALGDAPELTIGIAKDRLLAGPVSLPVGSDAKLTKFGGSLHGLGVSHLRLAAGLEAAELARFLDALATGAGGGPETLKEALEQAGLVHLGVGWLDYAKLAAQEKGKGCAPLDKATEEAVWRRLVLPASRAAMSPLSAAERGELATLVEEPELLRELLGRLEALPRRSAGGEGKAQVAEFARQLSRLLKTLTPSRRQAFIDRLAFLVASHQRAGGRQVPAPSSQGGQSLEAMAAALAAEGKATERLRTAYGRVLGEMGVAGPRAQHRAGGEVAATATAYLEEMFLGRSEAPYMSGDYAGELEEASAAESPTGMEGADAATLAALIDTLNPRRLAAERLRLCVELLSLAASEADVQALLAVIVQTAATLLKEGRLDEAGELLEAVYHGFYAQEGRGRIERMLADDVLGTLEPTPLLEHLLRSGRQAVGRERLMAVAALLPAKSLPWLLDRLSGGAEAAEVARSVLAGLGPQILPVLRERLKRPSGETLPRLLALLGAVGGCAEVAILEPYCRSARRPVRLEAVRALGVMGMRATGLKAEGVAAVEVLRRLMLSRLWSWGRTEARVEAARALAAIGSEQALEALREGARRRWSLVGQVCREFLERRGPAQTGAAA